MSGSGQSKNAQKDEEKPSQSCTPTRELEAQRLSERDWRKDSLARRKLSVDEFDGNSKVWSLKGKVHQPYCTSGGENLDEVRPY
jgi:hypothetical protein